MKLRHAAAVLGIATLASAPMASAAAPPAPTTAAHAARHPVTRALWPAAGAPAPAIPSITWHGCEERAQQRLGLQCATVPVPLDYAAPKGPKILLDLARHRATGRKIGSLFVNPGGPGGSAIDHMGEFLDVLGAPVTSRFDLVAMEPRGVGIESQAGCWSTTVEPAAGVDLPQSPAEVDRTIRHDAYARAACAGSGRPLIDHMSTGTVARDLDVLRQAVGDRQLTYYGVSYGTVLASTYAAMFPGKVRAVVEDGVVDPVEWTTGRGAEARTIPVSARGGSGAGADETLRAIFTACTAAGPKPCAQGTHLAHEWATLVEILRRGPVTTADGPLRLGDVLSSALVSMYDPATIAAMPQWIHADYLAATRRTPRAARSRPSGAPGLSTSGVITPTRPQPDASRFFGTFAMAGVMCSDSVNPPDEHAWATIANKTAASSWFTPVWTWNSSICAGWPGHDPGVYRGPFSVRTAHPLLIVGNTHDPATPLSAARSTAALFPGARLVTVDAYGHTAAKKSSGALAVMQRYLLTGALPAPGSRFRADKPLF